MTKRDKQYPPGGMVKSTLEKYYTAVPNLSETKIEKIIDFLKKLTTTTKIMTVLLLVQLLIIQDRR